MKGIFIYGIDFLLITRLCTTTLLPLFLEFVSVLKALPNKHRTDLLPAAQTNIERSMINIAKKDRRTNIWVSERTNAKDIISNTRKMKVLSRAHQPPQRRQMDLACHHLDSHLDKYWSDTIWQRKKTQDRLNWRQHAEAFAQPLDTMAAQ